ncbi:MAG: glycosyltransferase [Prevotella sp.]|nr:glycosyltransferase [Prevotella sp.]
MGKALIISLNFHPGHVSHMVASYRQLEELGYQSVYCVAEGFVPYLPKDSRICVYGKDEVTDVSVAVFVFPSQKNLLLIRKLKRQGAKIIYIFHEPLAPMKVYRKAGFSYKYLVKLWVINRISSLTVKWSDAVLVPSKKAEEYYHANPLYKNENVHYLPLLYDDERTTKLAEQQRNYFSYIGTVAADHSFNEYLQFVEWAIKGGRLPDLKFLIATKSEFDVPQTLAESSRVVIQKGRPLSDAEINESYASTFVVWNAYARTTQSGVLAKSFMFGTPAIVLRKNLSEFTADGQEVAALEDNTNSEEIEEAVLRITGDFEHYSTATRKRFEETFYYRQYNETFSKILASL